MQTLMPTLLMAFKRYCNACLDQFDGDRGRSEQHSGEQKGYICVGGGGKHNETRMKHVLNTYIPIWTRSQQETFTTSIVLLFLFLNPLF